MWDKDGVKNLFYDAKGELGLSKLAYQFLGGVLHTAEALCAIFNPTVNSYKRINAPTTLSGATWSPNTISYAGNNRTHMVRIPDPGRFEFRLMDGAANPYLMQAALLAAGLDGIQSKRDPGKRLDINMYTEGERARERQEAAAQPARCAPRDPEEQAPALRARRCLRRQLHQAQAAPVGRLQRRDHPLGARPDPRLLRSLSLTGQPPARWRPAPPRR